MRTTCLLPGGYWDENAVLHREAELLSLTGRDEELLAAKGASTATLITALLTRCVVRIGNISPVTEAVARSMLVGDRYFLLLKLRQLTFGDRVDATVRCPWPDCGEPVDVDFLISELPIKEAGSQAAVQDLMLSPEAARSSGLTGESAHVRYRLPNGSDQAWLTPLLSENEAEAATQLLVRCLVDVAPNQSLSEDWVRQLSPAARLEIEQHMERVAPGANLNLEARCPQCGRAFPLPFDVQDFIFGDVQVSHDLLYREVHYLAYHYHWSEHEILDMSREKRRRYIEMLNDEMEQLSHATG